MTERESVRLGCWAAFWGDTSTAVDQILDGAEVDYLVSDYLSEITMALLARPAPRIRTPGSCPTRCACSRRGWPEIHERGIKVVTNAGALNPAACAPPSPKPPRRRACRSGSRRSRATTCCGRLPQLRADGAADMFTGEPMPSDPMTMNAYLGARPIAAALAAGADVVDHRPVVDSAVVLGPLLHEFGWGDEDYDLLSAGTLAGHIVECGPQCTGGNFTDWDSGPGLGRHGLPDRSSATRTEPRWSPSPATPAGSITPATVGEQILYEIGDPGAYVMPDVVCDWREVTLEQAGPDRVRASGARGSGADRAPTRSPRRTPTATE